MRVSQDAAASNTGRKRRHNEDAFLCASPLFAVADGMGGARAGEVASSLATGALRTASVVPLGDAEAHVIGLIQAANRSVYERALSDREAAGMGTTMTVALVRPEGVVIIGHVGDSRAYLLRGGELMQLTDDHSLVAELVRRGELSPQQAKVHPQRSVITRALGTEAEVTVDAFTVQGQSDDVFLLCSDGLTSMVDADKIAAILGSHRDDLSAASRELIQAANDRGGEDNITAVLFSLSDDEPDAMGAARGADEITLHPEDEVTVPHVGVSTLSDTIADVRLPPPLDAPPLPEREHAPPLPENELAPPQVPEPSSTPAPAVVPATAAAPEREHVPERRRSEHRAASVGERAGRSSSAHDAPERIQRAIVLILLFVLIALIVLLIVKDVVT